MRKIFYLIPMLLVGLAFFACDDSDDGGSSAANSFTNPTVLPNDTDKTYVGAVVGDKETATYNALFGTDGELSSPLFYNSDKNGGGLTFNDPAAMPIGLTVFYGKVAADENTKVKKGEGTFYLLQPEARELLDKIVADGLELPSDTKIADTDDIKTAILEAAKAKAKKVLFYDKLGTEKSTFDGYFAKDNLKVTPASGQTPASVVLTTPSKKIELTVAAGGGTGNLFDLNTFVKAIATLELAKGTTIADDDDTKKAILDAVKALSAYTNLSGSEQGEVDGAFDKTKLAVDVANSKVTVDLGSSVTHNISLTVAAGGGTGNLFDLNTFVKAIATLELAQGTTIADDDDTKKAILDAVKALSAYTNLSGSEQGEVDGAFDKTKLAVDVANSKVTVDLGSSVTHNISLTVAAGGGTGNLFDLNTFVKAIATLELAKGTTIADDDDTKKAILDAVKALSAYTNLSGSEQGEVDGAFDKTKLAVDVANSKVTVDLGSSVTHNISLTVAAGGGTGNLFDLNTFVKAIATLELAQGTTIADDDDTKKAILDAVKALSAYTNLSGSEQGEVDGAFDKTKLAVDVANSKVTVDLGSSVTHNISLTVAAGGGTGNLFDLNTFVKAIATLELAQGTTIADDDDTKKAILDAVKALSAYTNLSGSEQGEVDGAFDKTKLAVDVANSKVTVDLGSSVTHNISLTVAQ